MVQWPIIVASLRYCMGIPNNDIMGVLGVVDIPHSALCISHLSHAYTPTTIVVLTHHIATLTHIATIHSIFYMRVYPTIYSFHLHTGFFKDLHGFSGFRVFQDFRPRPTRGWDYWFSLKNDDCISKYIFYMCEVQGIYSQIIFQHAKIIKM